MSNQSSMLLIEGMVGFAVLLAFGAVAVSVWSFRRRRYQTAVVVLVLLAPIWSLFSNAMDVARAGYQHAAIVRAVSAAGDEVGFDPRANTNLPGHDYPHHLRVELEPSAVDDGWELAASRAGWSREAGVWTRQLEGAVVRWRIFRVDRQAVLSLREDGGRYFLAVDTVTDS